MQKKSFFRLMGSQTFRFVLSLVMLFAITDVLKWLSMIWMKKTTYPGQNHASLMNERFFGGFIIGFLMQELPCPLLRSGGINIAKSLCLSPWAPPSVYLLSPVLPAYRIGCIHWSLVRGLSALTVSTRVILVHCANIVMLKNKTL